MLRSADARLADVRRIVDAARRLVHRRASIIPGLAASTGLSFEGVELALTRHLEVDATDDDLRKLVAVAGDADAVAVVLSANVFVGALRAVAIARAASGAVVVRPSRRDPYFARALVGEVGDARLVLDEALDITNIDRGEVHLYGRDETVADARARVRPGVRLRGHGAGMGVAWITAGAELGAAARDLADDIVAFNQRGCLSPRVALVEGADGRADAFAEALHAELTRFDRDVPRGSLDASERAASERYIATMTYAGQVLSGVGHAIGIAPASAPLVLPPSCRHVHVASCADPDQARVRLAPFARAIVAVGADDVDSARALAPEWARTSALGRMQRPPLDGPVDQRGGG